MKRWVKLSILLCIIVTAVLFFPVRKSYSISGDGVVLTLDKEKVRDCRISVEIQELRALAACYRRTFTFTVDGKGISDFEYNYDDNLSPSDLNLITQAYISDTDHAYHFYDFLYPADLSYALLKWEDNLYFIDNGASMAYSEIPYNHSRN